jgi:tRNA A37 threonylcarbamoyladenosine biosynthesis protein TsaE
MKKGKFITIDGVEGAGKSTQIDFIRQYLTGKGINIVTPSFLIVQCAPYSNHAHHLDRRKKHR